MRQSPCTTTHNLDDLATVSTDRTGVPKGGQVHVTVSDFRLNLDPTEKDEWTMWTNGSLLHHTKMSPPTG